MTDEELISHLRLQGLDKDIAAADRIEQLVKERDAMLRVVTDNHVALMRAEAAEAKLVKAVEALRQGMQCTEEHGGSAKFLKIARAVLAELEGKE